jgi:hypothetical protein
MGYSSKDKKPFDELSLVMEAESEVQKFLNQTENQHYKTIVEKTKFFLKGYYSPFGLELLSTIDFIKSEKQKCSSEDILKELENWSDRKRTLFANPIFIKKALSNINQSLA